MYCPNCGKENSVEQRFCRSCGISLLTISQALAHELSATESVGNSVESSVEKVNREQKGWQNPFLYGLLIIMLGLLITIFGKMILVEKLVSDIGVVIALLGVGLLGLKGVLTILPQSKVIPTSEALLHGEPTTKLPTALHSGELASVTEHTTRTLEPVYGERKSK